MPGRSPEPPCSRPRQSAELWRSIRDLDALSAPDEAPVWRLSVKPSDAPALVERLHRAFECRALYDWGGGLVWIAGGDGPDAGAGGDPRRRREPSAGTPRSSAHPTTCATPSTSSSRCPRR